MRVGLAADRFARGGRATGVGGYAEGIAIALATYAAAHEYVLLSTPERPPLAPERYGGLPVHPLARSRPLAHLSWGLLGRPQIRLRELGLDLVHVLVPAVPFPTRLPLVATVHDLMPLRFPRFYGYRARHFFRRALEEIRRSAAHVIANSEATRSELVELLGIESERISVVYPALPPHFRPVGAEATRRTWGRFGLTGQVVLFVGELGPRKNPLVLVDAFAAVADRLPDARLVLAGQPGHASTAVESRIDELGLRSHVLLPGRVSRQELVSLVAGADVLVQPSLWEGFGFPALEAMSCGVPVIASSAGSLPEVVGDAGLLIDPAQPEELAVAIARVLSDDALRARLGARGRARATTFSWQRAARETVAVYERALAR